jgi:ketosteroid isomerase-like protein
MKRIIFLSLSVLMITSCSHADNDKVKKEIFRAEKAFEKMAAEKGVAEAFYYFADEDAVIKRENDTLIIGKENIKNYYTKNNSQDATVHWTPDFTDVSGDGTMAYTYGKYIWKIKNKEGAITEYKGVFHTVWKKQKDGNWKYVWD